MKKLFYRKWWVVLFSAVIITGAISFITFSYNSEKKLQQDTKEPLDKSTYQKELKSHIDLFNAKYDQIVAKEWLPVWDIINENKGNVNKAELIEKMNQISNDFSELSSQMENFKAEKKLQDADLKEKMNHFRIAFIAASNYMKSAASSVSEHLSDGTPLNEISQNTLHPLGLADQNMVMALSTLSEINNILGIIKK
ncbi:hypothetical protein ACO11K_000761 [Bacillus cytotoxicus]